MNPRKTHQLSIAMVYSKLRFIKVRFMHRETKTEKEYIDRTRRILRKNLFSLPKGLKNNLYQAFETRAFGRTQLVKRDIKQLITTSGLL